MQGRSLGVVLGFTCVLLVALAVFGKAAQAQAAVDGNTIRLSGATWHLWGIEAPELRQTCKGWPAGSESRRALERLMAAGRVQCEERGWDRNGRMLGLCRAAGRDLGAEMVAAGMAWALTRPSPDYVAQEQAAIGARLGVHAHSCSKTSDRKRQPR